MSSKKSTVDIMPNGEMSNAFLLRLNKTSVSTLTNCMQHFNGVKRIRQEKKKRHTEWKGRNKIAFIHCKRIIYVENLKQSTKKVTRTNTSSVKSQNTSSIYKIQLCIHRFSNKNFKIET